MLNGEELRQVLGSVASLVIDIPNESFQENFRTEPSI